MFLVFNNFSETPCSKVGFDVRIPLIRVPSTGGWLLQMLILFDDDIKESVKATNVQKCNFSQS